ncbi:hypothetical protein DOY81_012350, partial [Sarcophaga bullata]
CVFNYQRKFELINPLSCSKCEPKTTDTFHIFSVMRVPDISATAGYAASVYNPDKIIITRESQAQFASLYLH